MPRGYALVCLLMVGQPAAVAADIEAFLPKNARQCAIEPVSDCFRRAFSFIDNNNDQLISIEEARSTHQAFGVWLQANEERLPPIDRQAIAMSLVTIELVGLEPLLKSYDFNRDGAVDAAEISADLALDERPISEWIQDPASVDWQRLTGRLGQKGNIIRELLKATGIQAR